MDGGVMCAFSLSGTGHQRPPSHQNSSSSDSGAPRGTSTEASCHVAPSSDHHLWSSDQVSPRACPTLITIILSLSCEYMMA